MLGLSGDALPIYLQDHYAGATAGLELARRARGENEGSELGAFHAALAEQIADDRRALEGVMRTLGVGPDRLKLVTAWTAEKIGRLKPNGSLRSYTQLSRLVELEGLLIGVTGKLALWRRLRELAEHDGRLDAAELDRLVERASEQLDGLWRWHERTAAAAFAQRRSPSQSQSG